MTPEEIVRLADMELTPERRKSALEHAIATALREAEARGLDRAAGIAERGYWSSALDNSVGRAIAAAIRAEKERKG